MNHFHRSAAYKNAHFAAAPLGRRVFPVLLCFLAALFLSAAAVSAGTVKIKRESFPKKKSAYTGTSGSFTVNSLMLLGRLNEPSSGSVLITVGRTKTNA